MYGPLRRRNGTRVIRPPFLRGRHTNEAAKRRTFRNQPISDLGKPHKGKLLADQRRIGEILAQKSNIYQPLIR